MICYLGLSAYSLNLWNRNLIQVCIIFNHSKLIIYYNSDKPTKERSIQSMLWIRWLIITNRIKEMNDKIYFFTHVLTCCILFTFTDCHFGKKVYELEETWHPDLGSPFGTMYCIRCECIAVSHPLQLIFI